MATQFGPSQLDPADWSTVGVFYLGDSEEIMRDYDYAWTEICENFGDDSFSFEDLFEQVTFHDNGGCASCGTHFLHGAIVTNGTDTIAIGGTCLESFGLSSKTALIRKRSAQRGETARQRIAAEEFIQAHGLAEVLKFDHYITQDIERKLYRYGSISPKQIDLLHKLPKDAAEQAERLAEQAKLLAQTPQLAEGRYEISGEIKSVKFQESYYGDTLKMLVEFDGANRVWGTVPKSIWDEAEKGLSVTFTATVERSKDDDHFGFFKRPTKAIITSKEEATV